MLGINKKLVLLKLLLFSFYGALGCVMVFLNIHMRYLGLSIQEVTWINAALPLTALIGPPLVGMLADKIGHYRPITIVCMLLATSLHVALLFVPSCHASTTTDSTLSLRCDSEGAAIEVQSCLSSCTHPVPLLPVSVQVDSCHLLCPETSTNTTTTSRLERSEARASKGRPNAQLQMQLRSVDGVREFLNVDGKQVIITFNKSLTPQEMMEVAVMNEEGVKEDEEESGVKSCLYPIQNFTYGRTDYSTITCSKIAPECEMVCDVTKLGNETQLLDTSSCCNSDLTVWLYFCLRALAEMFIAILVSLLEAVTLTMVRQHNGDYGREKMFGLISVAIFSPVCGYLVDSEVGTFGSYSYAPVFYVFVGLMLVTMAVTPALPIQVQVQQTSMSKNIMQLVRTGEMSVLLFLMVVLGTFWGYLKTFVYLYLEDISASKLLIGLTSSFCIVPSLPFLYKSSAVVKYCGHHYLIMLAFVGYCIRFAGLSYISNPWWVLLLESLELFTLNLLNVSAATLAYKLAPKTVATAQALVWVSHFNIGRCIGTFFGGHLLLLYGHVHVFQGAAVMAAFCAAVYLAIHQLIKYLKQRENTQPKPPTARENGNVANGHYTPLQVADDRF